MFTRMVKYRQLQLEFIDSRVKLLHEVIDNIRSVKLYAYTDLFGDRVEKLRKDELEKLKVNGFNRATMNATMVLIPTLAAVCESPSPCNSTSLI
jgi:ATP-binding cassette subfamily C (CFTR/MRP) protein 1